MRFLCGLAGAVLFTFSAAAQLVVGPEVQAPDDRVTRAPFRQSETALASDGTNFLAVWADERAETHRQIYAARITPLGEVLDPLGIRLTNWPRNVFDADVTFGPVNYMVLDAGLVLTEVSPAGAVVARHTPLTQSGPAGNLLIRWTGSNYLLIWGYGSIQVSFVDSSGQTATTPFRIGDGMVQDVAVEKDRAIILFLRGAALYEIVIKFDGTSAGPEQKLDDNTGIGIERNTARAAADGTSFFVTWIDSLAHSVKGLRIDSAGAPVAAPILLATKNSNGVPVLPNVTWTGSDYLAAWYRGNTFLSPGILETVHVDRSGAIAGTPRAEIESPVIGLSDFSLMSAAGTTLFVGAFAHPDTEAEDEIFMKRLGVGDNLHLVTRGRPAKSRPSIAANASLAFVVWEDRQGSTIERPDPIVAGSLWTTDGSPLTQPFEIDPGGASQMEPYVTAGANTFLVQWHDYTSNDYRLFDARGNARTAVMELEHFSPYGERGRAARATWTGKKYAIARTFTTIDIVTIDEDGTSSSPSQPLPLTSGVDFAPAAFSCNPSICVAAWVNAIGALSRIDYEIRMARYSLSGVLLDSAPISVSKNVIGGPLTMTVVNKNFVLAWQTDDGIHAATIDASHETVLVRESILGSPLNWFFTPIATASLGHAAIVTWQNSSSDIVAALVKSDFAGPPILVSADPRRESNPDVASAGDHVLAVYDRVSTEDGVSTIFVRRLAVESRRRAITH